MVNYPLGDYLIQIKNIARAGKNEITVVSTKVIKSVSDVLKTEGFLESNKLEEGNLTSKLAIKNKQPVLFDLKLVSKPGLRIYKNFSEVKTRKDKSSILILSTSKGIMSSTSAIKSRLGGEVIAEIY